jgi:hypothetical protein
VIVIGAVIESWPIPGASPELPSAYVPAPSVIVDPGLAFAAVTAARSDVHWFCPSHEGFAGSPKPLTV